MANSVTNDYELVDEEQETTVKVNRVVKDGMVFLSYKREPIDDNSTNSIVEKGPKIKVNRTEKQDNVTYLKFYT